MKASKKIKKQKKSPGLWAHSGYAKLSQLYTREIVQGLIQQLLGRPSKLQSLVDLTKIPENSKFLFFFIDEIDGGSLESLLKGMGSELVAELACPENMVRCKNAWLKNTVKASLWDDVLDFRSSLPIDKDSPPSECSGDISDVDVAKMKLAKLTKLLKAKIYAQEDDTSPEADDEIKGIPSVLAESLLTAEEMQKNSFPTPKDNYKSTSEFLGDSTAKMEVIGLDCEMVKTTEGTELAQIVVIDANFKVLLSRYVKPHNEITDYLTVFSGISKETYDNEPYVTLAEVQEELGKIMGPETLVVGHGLDNDFHALRLVHGRFVDTSILFQRQTNYKLSLKNLAFELFGIKIQEGAHDPAEDAKVAFALARLKIEALDPYLQLTTKPQFWSIDNLNDLHNTYRVSLIDFEYNVKRLLQSEVTYELVLRQEDVLKKTLESLRGGSHPGKDSRLVFTRYSINKNHDYSSKLDSLKLFLEALRGLQKEVPVAVCISSMSYRRQDPEGVFGYDLLIMF